MDVVQVPSSKEDHIEFAVIATAKEVSRAFDKAAEIFATKEGLELSGGISVYNAVEAQLGIRDLDSIISPDVSRFLLIQAIEQGNITPAFFPVSRSMDTIVRGKDYAFSVLIYPKPSFELTSYEPLSISAPLFEVDLSEVQDRLNQLALYYATYTRDSKNKGPVSGNSVFVCSAEIKKDGAACKDLSFSKETIILDETGFPDGFKQNILGMKCGEEKEFTFSIPQSGDDPDVQYEACVNVHEFLKCEKPTITDAWVMANLPECKDKKGLLSQIIQEVQVSQRSQYNEMLNQLLISAVSERFNEEIPELVLLGTINTILESTRKYLSSQNRTFEDFIEEMGGEEAYKETLFTNAYNDLVRDYSLDAVYRHFNLSVSQEEIKKMCSVYSPDNPDEVYRTIEEEHSLFIIRETAQRNCALNYLRENANIRYFDPQDIPKNNNEFITESSSNSQTKNSREKTTKAKGTKKEGEKAKSANAKAKGSRSKNTSSKSVKSKASSKSASSTSTRSNKVSSKSAKATSASSKSPKTKSVKSKASSKSASSKSISSTSTRSKSAK